MPLQFNPTGDLVANRVTGEVIPVTPAMLATYGLIYPDKGPFFGSNFVLTYTPTGIGQTAQTLVRGTHFDYAFELRGWGDADDPTSKVWGALVIYNQAYSGSLNLSYQALGGNWTFNRNKIRDYLGQTPFNGQVQEKVLCGSEPIYLPGNSLVEVKLNSIHSISIAQQQLIDGILLAVEYILKGDEDQIPRIVDVLSTPLPPNAAKENGGQLAVIAGAQGTSATGVNQLTGGTGILGWLSGVYSKASALVANLTTIIARLDLPFSAAQSGNWAVGLNAGENTVGNFFGTAFTEIADATTTAGYIYICEAAPGSSAAAAVWRIQRITIATGSVAWADGVATFTKVANNRASFTYS